MSLQQICETIPDFETATGHKLDDTFSVLSYLHPQVVAITPQLVEEIRTRVHHGTFFNMRIVEEDIKYTGNIKNIALDTRTGNTFSYNPQKNSHTRPLSELDMLQKLIPREADLIYKPKVKNDPY